MTESKADFNKNMNKHSLILSGAALVIYSGLFALFSFFGTPADAGYLAGRICGTMILPFILAGVMLLVAKKSKHRLWISIAMLFVCAILSFAVSAIGSLSR